MIIIVIRINSNKLTMLCCEDILRIQIQIERRKYKGNNLNMFSLLYSNKIAHFYSKN